VFISYSRRDGKDVDLLARTLKDGGHKVWLDRSAIQGGAKWQEEIVRGIEKANVFVIVLSPQSIESENVERELGLAHVTGKRILPVMLHPVELPARLQYALEGLGIIDVSTDNIANGSQRVLQAIASPDTGRGLVYLNPRWYDKLWASLPGIMWAFLFLVLPFFERRLKTEWPFQIGFLFLVAAFLVSWAFRTFRRPFIRFRLKNKSTVLSTGLKGLAKFRGNCRIVSEWRDPETGKHYTFYSKTVSIDLSKFVNRTIPVNVDPRNFKRYWMDLSFLPKEPRGSLVLLEPGEVASNQPQAPLEVGDSKYDIFLSHSEHDSEVAIMLGERLEAAGHTVWHANGAILEERAYEEQAIDGIASARLFLLVLSPDSAQSTRVRSELYLAVSKGKRIITVVVRRTTVPEELNYALANVQHVDLSEDFEIALMRLVDTIAAKTPKMTVVPETCVAKLAAWAAWLGGILKTAARFLGYFPVMLIAMFVQVNLWWVSKVLPARLRRPSLLEPKWMTVLLAPWTGDHGFKLKDRGTLLLTEYETFGVRLDDQGHRDAIRIFSQWRDPVSHQRYRFSSNWLACEPEHIKTKIVPVYVDPMNLRRYSVDWSFVPESQRREAPKRAPKLRRLRNRFRASGLMGEEAPSLASMREKEDTARKGIFISYSNENADKAKLLMERLEREGYDVVNRSGAGGKPPGVQDSENQIGLAETLLMIVPSASASDLASKVHELRHAYTLNKRIMPVTFDRRGVAPSMQLSLAGVQRVDLSQDLELGMRQLLDALAPAKGTEVAAPDRHAEAPLLGGRVQRIVSGAIIGALSWAMGSTVSVVWLDRSPGMNGLIRVALPVVLVIGGVVGGIFYKRKTKVRVKNLFALFLFLEILTLVAVAPFAGGLNAYGDTLAVVVSPIVSVAAFVANKWIQNCALNYRLKKRGKLVFSEYKGPGESQWRDPVTDEVHTFVRGFRGPLSERVRSKTIAVFIDPANPSDYYMDLSYSPKSKE
jgi:TIR domain